jgi:hypothetical protein
MSASTCINAIELVDYVLTILQTWVRLRFLLGWSG